MSVQTRPSGEVRYPETDGVPVGETETHYEAILDLVHQLRVHFRDRVDDVHVSANQFWYFEEGNPRSVVCPDVYVVFGAPSRPARDVWKTWEDHCFPSVVFEFTSRSTRRVDAGYKRDLYERLGVQEMWLFDPLGEYLAPRLQGWWRRGDRFEPAERDSAGRWVSRALGGLLFEDHTRVVLVVDDGAAIPPVFEVFGQLQSARHEAELHAQRADQESQRAELESRRAELESRRADQESRRAEQESQRAEREARRADRLAERLRELGVKEEES